MHCSIDQRLNSAYSSSLTNSDVDIDFGNYSGNSSRRHSRPVSILSDMSKKSKDWLRDLTL